MSLLAVALAVTGAWFDANVAGSAKWPSGTDPVEVAGAGTWNGRGFVTATGKALAYSEAYGAGLSFAPTVARDAADGEISFTTEMTFTARKRFAASDGAKAAISVLGDGTDAAYYGLVTNAWVKLEGATPVLDEPVTATVTLKRTDDGLLVRYAVNGTTLTADGAEWLKSSATESVVTRLSYQGTGAVASLAGEASGVANCTLTVPETIEGMTVSAFPGRLSCAQASRSKTRSCSRTCRGLTSSSRMSSLRARRHRRDSRTIGRSTTRRCATAWMCA